MKLHCVFSSAVASLLLGVLIAGCSHGPGVKVLDRPVVENVAANALFKGGRYSASTREVLRREGLERRSKRDPDSVIQTLNGKLRSGDAADVRLAAAEVSLVAAIRNEDDDSMVAAGYILTATKLSEPALAYPDSPHRALLVSIYDESCAALATKLHDRHRDGEPMAVKGPLDVYQLKCASGGSPATRMDTYDVLIAADRLKVSGFKDSNSRPGVGGSLVGFRRGTPERRAKDPFMPTSGYSIPLTATMRWSGSTGAEVVLHDSLSEERVTINGRSYALAGDYTAAVASAAAASPKGKVGWMGMIHPQEESSKEGLHLLGPYRADRIPLVLVHGLMSSPETWEKLINACYGDPVIRRNYQILVFFYPTGYPIPANAASLRSDMAALQREFDPGRSNSNMRNIVMVGHSMGCNLTNFQIRDGGDKLWSKFFEKPIDQLEIAPELKEDVRKSAYFKANRDITRAVFVCAPHRGSPLADSWLGRLGNELIQNPFGAFDNMTGGLMSASTGAGRSILNESPSSIENLKVDSPILLSILEQPMPAKPVVHSIIGDRGRKPGPGSSDGVVPYWSSQLDGVKSETFIPAWHTTATGNEENANEILRILYEHLGKRYSKPADEVVASGDRKPGESPFAMAGHKR